MTTPTLAITVGAILLLTALAWLLRRAVLPRLCPLCAGVAGTWIALLGVHWAGVELDLRLPALLLGGSVVGLAGLGEAALAGRSPGATLAWKTAFVVTGFATAYALLLSAWPGVALGAVALLALQAVLWLPGLRTANAEPTGSASARRMSLLTQLKNCC
jgi:hypothetical protein